MTQSTEDTSPTLPNADELEVVAWRHPIAKWASGFYASVHSHCQKDGPPPEPLVTLSSAQAQIELLTRERDEAAEARDALLSAIGFKPGPFKDALSRKVILDDASGLRPEMVRARRAAQELRADLDWDRMATAELLRKWVRHKFGKWITWRTAWSAVDEVHPPRSALSGGTSNG
jgi:hypothetical protein